MKDERVGVRPGTVCPRCGATHRGVDSQTCEACWLDLGQMELFDGLFDKDAGLPEGLWGAGDER